MRKRRCPICQTEGNPGLKLSDKFLRQHYDKNYPSPIPRQLDLGNYTMYSCPNCLLEWADPMLPGSDAYYTWLTQHSDYYPRDRWEWQQVFQLLKPKREISLLEIGCGTGQFLSLCSDRNITATGLDLTASSVKTAKKQGLDAHCISLEKFATKTSKKYDYVVAFHLLEHVSDPIDIVRQMRTILNPQGKIYLSTPYTTRHPLQWFDYLNYPPHHMTRWNQTAYSALAQKLNLKPKFYMPTPTKRSPLTRIINQLKLIAFEPRKMTTSTQRDLVIFMLFHPKTVFLEISAELRREKIINQKVDYVVLVELAQV